MDGQGDDSDHKTDKESQGPTVDLERFMAGQGEHVDGEMDKASQEPSPSLLDQAQDAFRESRKFPEQQAGVLPGGFASGAVLLGATETKLEDPDVASAQQKFKDTFGWDDQQLNNWQCDSNVVAIAQQLGEKDFWDWVKTTSQGAAVDKLTPAERTAYYKFIRSQQ